MMTFLFWFAMFLLLSDEFKGLSTKRDYARAPFGGGNGVLPEQALSS
jgi:hypothetical protein